ncbi:MAG: transketolase [Raoultibacter sp.]|jgi:transketolase
MSITEVANKANEVRKDILRMITKAGSGHPGGSLSSADILAALYFGGVLRYDPSNPKAPERDYFIMSKGHAAPALYATLAHAGFFLKDELMTLRQLGSRLQGHPDSNLLESVEVSTGSLGQGLSIASGLASGLRLDSKSNTVFTLLGDGECEEGQVWEAANFAAHQNLGNLIAIVDVNGLQIDGYCCNVCSSGDLADKFAAFGWEVSTVDGHDIAAMVELFSQLKAKAGSTPHVVLAETTKGKDVSFMEDQAGWHGKAPSEDQLAAALEELMAKGGQA